MLLCVVVLVSAVCAPLFVHASVAIQPYVPKPPEFESEEGCYNEKLNIVLPYNETYRPICDDQCISYLCRTDNTTLIEGCGAVGYDKENCVLTRDYTQAYPCCCGTLACKDRGPFNVGGADCQT